MSVLSKTCTLEEIRPVASELLRQNMAGSEKVLYIVENFDAVALGRWTCFIITDLQCIAIYINNEDGYKEKNLASIYLDKIIQVEYKYVSNPSGSGNSIVLVGCDEKLELDFEFESKCMAEFSVQLREAIKAAKDRSK